MEQLQVGDIVKTKKAIKGLELGTSYLVTATTHCSDSCRIREQGLSGILTIRKNKTDAVLLL